MILQDLEKRKGEPKKSTVATVTGSAKHCDGGTCPLVTIHLVTMPTATMPHTGQALRRRYVPPDYQPLVTMTPLAWQRTASSIRNLRCGILSDPSTLCAAGKTRLRSRAKRF